MADPKYSQADRVILGTLNAHLQRHKDKLDPKSHDQNIILFGEHKDGGLCATAKDLENRIENMEKVNDEMKRLRNAVIAAILAQIVLAIPQIIAVL